MIKGLFDFFFFFYRFNRPSTEICPFHSKCAYVLVFKTAYCEYEYWLPKTWDIISRTYLLGFVERISNDGQINKNLKELRNSLH